MSPTGNRHWYAVHVKSRHEKVVAASLVHKGFHPFLPLYSCQHQWADRKKEVSLPLFPGYLFCQLDLARRLPLLTCPGVVRLVGYGNTPYPVDEAEITAIQRIVASGLPAEPASYLRTGEEVSLTGGPLAGLRGIILSIKDSTRLLVSVSLLQRSLTVEVCPDWVSPVAPGARTPASTAAGNPGQLAAAGARRWRGL